MSPFPIYTSNVLTIFTPLETKRRIKLSDRWNNDSNDSFDRCLHNISNGCKEYFNIHKKIIVFIVLNL